MAERLHSAQDQLLAWLADTVQIAVERISPSATLDSLGVDSLTSIEMRAKLAAAFGVRVPASSWDAGTTVAEMLTSMTLAMQAPSSARPPAAKVPLVWLRSASDEPAIVWIHPVGGGITCYRALARGLPFPSAAIEAPGLRDEASQRHSIEEIASSYIEALRGQREVGPLILAGWSFGGVVAYEMAIQLARAHERVGLVAMIDSYLPQPCVPAPGDLSSRARVGSSEANGMSERGVVREFIRDLCGSAPGASRALEAWLDTAMSEDYSGDVRELVMSATRKGLLRDIAVEDAERLLRVFTGNAAALGRYRAGAYDGPVLSVRASQAHGDPDALWRQCAVNLRVSVVDGDHHSIMRAPAQELIRIVHTELSRRLGIVPRRDQPLASPADA